MEQFDKYIHSADYITIPWINIKVPALYQTTNKKEKIEIAQDISSELSVKLQNSAKGNSTQEGQAWVDLTVLQHKNNLEKLRIDADSPIEMGKLEKLIECYFHLLKIECPKMQVYQDSFLAEADFQMISFEKQDCRKYLITFLIKQYFMCCVELEKKSITKGYQDFKSVAEDAHFQELKKLIFDVLKVSDQFQDNKLDLIRVIDALTNKVASDSILAKKENQDPLLINFLNEIEILKAMIAKFMREESEQNKTAAIKPTTAVPPFASTSAASAATVVDKKTLEEAGLQISQSVHSMQGTGAACSFSVNKYVTPLMMSQALSQTTGSQSTDALCHSTISSDSLDSALNASIASLEASCIASQSSLTNKS